MKKLYDLNKWSIIITLLLYFTFWGGIMAQVVLGAIQILMSLYILAHFRKLSKVTKALFITYAIITISITGLFRIMSNNGGEGLGLMFVFIIVSMLLAIFHLYVTYKIKMSSES